MNRENGRGMTVSTGFYLGFVPLMALLVAGALLLPAARPLADQHANPVPATALPPQVTASPRSNLYHAGAACPYVHSESKTLPVSEAQRRGLVPCPFCIGNSAARLTPAIVARQPARQGSTLGPEN